MENVAKQDLELAVKEMTLQLLDQLIKDNIKGAELLKQDIEDLEKVKEHYDLLVEIIKALTPIFKYMYEKAKEWLASTYEHLVAVFEWAKNLWYELFGSSQAA